MRLIDADKLRWSIRNNAPKYVPLWVYETIDEAPNAYDVDSVVQQIKTLSPANYVSKDDVLKIVKGDNFSTNSEKNSFFNFDEVLRIECEKARSKAIDDFVAEFKNKDSELRKSCNNWYEFADRIAEQLKKEVEE